MPRKSAASLSVQRVRLPEERPEPPAELAPDEAMEWRRIVGTMPATWFTDEMFPLLIMLCQMIVTRRRIAVSIKSMDVKADGFKDLTKQDMQYGTLITQIATKLRLTPQSRYARDECLSATKEAVSARAHHDPWEKEAAA